MLHLINKSPFSSASLDSCLRFATKGSPILLFEDGVYGAMAGTSLESKITEAMKDHPVYVIKEDAAARAVANFIAGIKEIDYPGFVDLVQEHKTCSWT